MSGKAGPAFARYVGIDYSGAETPTSSLKGLRVYLAERESAAIGSIAGYRCPQVP